MNLDTIFDANRANWDERVAVHLAPGGHDLTALRAGHGRLDALEERELPELVGPLDGKRVLHLQCHFGADSLALAQRGAIVTGVDFSGEAIRTATALAAELGLTDCASFIECNVYDTLDHLPETGCYDLVYVTWGCIGWLPDMTKWAAIIAACLKPGGVLYLADGHPSALVFDDCVTGTQGKPGWFAPYFECEPLELDETQDYSNADATLQNSRVYAWMHGLGEIASALLEQGLEIRALREHDAVAWRMFSVLEKGEDGLFRWPDKPWLPLSFTILARRIR